MVKITYDASNLQKALKKIGRGHEDMTPLFRAISLLELSNTALRYDDGVDPKGKRWRDPITMRRNEGGGGWHRFSRAMGDRPMIDTGNLRSSIQSLFGKNYAEVGTNVKYGKYVHALGFEFLGVSSETSENIKNAYKSYIKGLM